MYLERAVVDISNSTRCLWHYYLKHRNEIFRRLCTFPFYVVFMSHKQAAWETRDRLGFVHRMLLRIFFSVFILWCENRAAVVQKRTFSCIIWIDSEEGGKRLNAERNGCFFFTFVNDKIIMRFYVLALNRFRYMISTLSEKHSHESLSYDMYIWSNIWFRIWR